MWRCSLRLPPRTNSCFCGTDHCTKLCCTKCWKCKNSRMWQKCFGRKCSVRTVLFSLTASKTLSTDHRLTVNHRRVLDFCFLIVLLLEAETAASLTKKQNSALEPINVFNNNEWRLKLHPRCCDFIKKSFSKKKRKCFYVNLYYFQIICSDTGTGTRSAHVMTNHHSVFETKQNRTVQCGFQTVLCHPTAITQMRSVSSTWKLTTLMLNIFS